MTKPEGLQPLSLSEIAHEMECARAAIAARIEATSSRSERQEWREFLKELEQKWAEDLF